MARGQKRLSDRKLASLSEPGAYHDGNGLYAIIGKSAGSRSWLLKYCIGGRRREMGLGSLTAVGLAQARELAAQHRFAIAQGRDPLAERLAVQRTEAVETRRKAGGTTFGAVADALIASKEAGWRNDKHRWQWRATITRYASPLLARPVDQITTDDILAVLQPIWHEKPETASRLRSRIEAVLNAAQARGMIAPGTANPARWRGHLDHLLPKPQKLTRGHQRALPWKEVPRFIADLREREELSARALEFCILTAARLGEVLGARWGEIDYEARLWICPAERMKNKKLHRVALSDAALAVLDALPEGEPDALIFPGQKPGKPYSNMVMAALQKRMGYAHITTHGFRSSFRDWAGEATDYPREVCELALAHRVGDAVEQAYRRGDGLEKRRALMADWAAFCAGHRAGA